MACPEAGEHVHASSSTNASARQLAGERATRLKAESLARVRSGKATVTLDNIFGSDLQELNLLVKADVAGSLEAIEDEDRQAAAGRGVGQRHPPGGGRGDRVRRDAGRCL